MNGLGATYIPGNGAGATLHLWNSQASKLALV